MFPKLCRLRQQRHDCRRHLAVSGRERPLLAVARTGIRQNFSHDAPGHPAHIAVRVHEKLIQKHERLALVGLRHVGAVFLQQTQVHADALEVLFALGLLEQLLERLVGRKRMHEADGAVQRQVPQRKKRLVRAHEGRILYLVRQKLILAQLRTDAAALQQVFKVRELMIDVFIPERLLRRHIGKLAEDHLIRLGERMDVHDLLFARLPRATHAEIGIDEQQRLDRQVFKLQIPRGMVCGDVADLLHIVPAEPLPGIIIVQIGDPAQIRAAAAEFADIVAERRRADERQVDREAGLFRKDRRMQRDIMHADGMRGRVKRRCLHPEAHHGQNVILAHGLPEQAVLRLHAAPGQSLLRQRKQIEIGIKAVCTAGKRRFQHIQI